MTKSKLSGTIMLLFLPVWLLFSQDFDPGFYYQLKNEEGKVLGNAGNSSAGAYLFMETYNQAAMGQYWQIDGVGGGFVMLNNILLAQSVDNNNSNNRQVLQWNTTPSNQNQHWRLTPVAGKAGWYTLSARSNPFQNIEVRSNGSLHTVAPNSSDASQQFQLVKTDMVVEIPVPEYWEDETVFEENKEKAHASYFPYPDRAALLADSDYFLYPWKETGSTLVQSLNGNWKFKLVKQPADTIPGFYANDFDVNGWEDISVPSNWEMQGFGHPFYMNEEMPFANQPPFIRVRSNVSPFDNNSVGAYRRTFNIPASWSDKQIFVNFEGIYSAAYIYVNGSYVGYTEAANTDHEFDISSFVTPGENMIAVKVIRWSDGSYLENQDMFRMSGIYRDVNLIALPKTFVRDHLITSEMASPSANEGTLHVDLWVQNRNSISSSGSVEVEFLTADGQLIQQLGPVQNFTLEAGAEQQLRLSAEVSDIALWSAEHPNLYTVLVKLKDDSGRETEAFSSKYGFRTVELKNSLVYVNGQRILFKGANRHDTDPETGRAVTTEMMLKDVLLYKQYNLNMIRTSHYPNPAKMYAMFDHYGLWVMDEADLECHGAQQLSGVASWIPAFNNRVERMIYRDRNHPSVVFWSLGNECGGGNNFVSAYALAKQIDATRPIHYEGGNSKYNPFTDMQSKMYPSVGWVHAEGNDGTNRPLFICEYAHAMGNGVGNLQEYVDAMEAGSRTIGGCIWDWIDQAIYDPALLKQGIKRAYSTGYDYHGPHQGNFCSNGILSPAREVTPKLVEVKKAYQYVQISDFDPVAGTVKLTNKYAFTNLDQFQLRWTVVENGVSFETGTAGIGSTAPGAETVISIPYSSTGWQANKEYVLRVELMLEEHSSWNEWAEPGQSFALEQFNLTAAPSLVKINSGSMEGTFSIEEVGTQLRIGGNNFNLVFNKTNGKMTTLVMDGTNVIQASRGFEFDGWRFIENDTSNPNIPTASFSNKPLSYELSDDGKSILVKTTRTSIGECDYDINYTIYVNGVIDMETQFVPLSNDLFRLGLAFTMNKTLENVDYIARGPMENYVDRKSGSFMGHYQTTVDDMVQDYVRPQSMGNREDLRKVTFTDSEGKGITIETEGQVAFSSLRYSDYQLAGKLHFYDLIPSESNGITVHLDYMQRGLGNGSCCGGTGPLSEYYIPMNTAGYKLRITPASGVDISSYCEPTGTIKGDGYAVSIDFAGTTGEFNYRAEAPLNSVYRHLPGKPEAVSGSTIEMQVVSKEGGNDFRHNYAAVFVDWNHDLQFTEDELITVVGLRGQDKPAAGNMGVLNFTVPIELPADSEASEYRLRIIFDDADFDGDIVEKVCGGIVNGAVYDIDILTKSIVFCTPGGTFHSEKKAFLTSIVTEGAYADYSYTSESFPGAVYVRPEALLLVKPGSEFTLKLTANNAGPRGQVHQDLRYNYAAIYADWDLDGEFELLEIIGKASTDNGFNNQIANYDDVLEIVRNISVPVNAATGQGVIRVIYHNAWQPKESLSACMQTINEGIAYDILVEVVPLNTSVEKKKTGSKFKIYPQPVKDHLNIEGNFDKELLIQLIDINGRVAKSEVSRAGSSHYSLDVAGLKAGFYILQINDGEQQGFTGKVLKF